MSSPHRTKAVVVGAAILALAGTGGAVAAGQIGSAGIKDDSIQSVDLKDGAAVSFADLNGNMKQRLNAAANPVSKTIDFQTENGDSRVANPRTIVLKGDPTSVEAENVGIPVQAGDIISFDVTMQGTASCAAGSPRMYVTIDGQPSNTFDADNSTHGCPGDNAPGSDEDGRVNFVVPNSGTIGSLYFVHDNGTGGTVYVENLLINGAEVLFK